MRLSYLRDMFLTFERELRQIQEKVYYIEIEKTKSNQDCESFTIGWVSKRREAKTPM